MDVRYVKNWSSTRQLLASTKAHQPPSRGCLKGSNICALGCSQVSKPLLADAAGTATSQARSPQIDCRGCSQHCPKLQGWGPCATAVVRQGMGWGQSDQAAACIKGQGTVTIPQKPASPGPWSLWRSDLPKGCNQVFGNSHPDLLTGRGELSPLGLKLLLNATTRTVSPVMERTDWHLLVVLVKSKLCSSRGSGLPLLGVPAQKGLRSWKTSHH